MLEERTLAVHVEQSRHGSHYVNTTEGLYWPVQQQDLPDYPSCIERMRDKDMVMKMIISTSIFWGHLHGPGISWVCQQCWENVIESEVLQLPRDLFTSELYLSCCFCTPLNTKIMPDDWIAFSQSVALFFYFQLFICHPWGRKDQEEINIKYICGILNLDTTYTYII